MKNIKFRAWDKEVHNTGKVIYQMKYFTINTLLDGYDNDLPAEPIGESVPEYPEGRIMQYTGLLDKNGKEIYEGDIIQTDFSGVGKVVFDMAEFAIDFPYDDSRHLYCYKSREVIGNIYETPELLK